MTSTHSTYSDSDLEDQTITPKNEVDTTYEVDLEDHEHPQNQPLVKKWFIVILISLSATSVTCASSAAAFAENGMAQEFHVSKIVAILSVSLFVEGLGFGPLLVGPLSEVYGRNVIYRVSFALLFAFSWAVAFAPNIEVLLIFRFITGFCGSAFLSVAGGSVSDLFVNEEVATPMAFYTVSPFIGPAVGPLFSGFINQHIHWRWTFHVITIWAFVQTVALFLFVRETYVPVLRKWKAARLRKELEDDKYWAPIEYEQQDLFQSILRSCYKPFQLMFYDQMALLLNLWTSVILGILYLAFQAFPVIFGDNHGFNMQSVGLSFLGIGIGMAITMPTQVLWNRLYAKQTLKHGGALPPEFHLLKGEVGAILVPVGLFWLAFTTYPHVHWIVPIIASIPFGAGSVLVFSSVFTYLVTAYRPIAASAMASNSAMRSTVAAVFPLFAGAMYDRLGTVGATAVLAGIMAGLAPLPFIFRRIGARLRAKSRFAVA
ncbi:MFS general substrate transporter [Marasmius fiardii PR-910]|nr:MFS general substrate transporter [Marasmius fiardii PR-910]